MLAITTTGIGDLRFDAVDTPVPGPGEVRIAVAAAAINPVDMATRDEMLHAGAVPSGTPIGLGWDVAGIVDASGDASVPVGTRVAGLRGNPTTPLGAYAEFVLLPSAAVAEIPDGIDTVEAASLPLNLLTADQALDLAGDPSTLLVTGAAGAVGGFAVALATKRGWTVTALGRDTDHAFLDSAGASRIITDIADAGEYDVVLDAATLGADRGLSRR